ncbi:glycosyltransferase family 2 protein [Lysobacter humi (ex Lee et al. 2017)]
MADGCATGGALPVVVVTVGVDEQALDACLAALDAGTPAGTRVWLADDAQGGPRVQAVVDVWRSRTRLDVAYTRRTSPLGESTHLADVLAACSDDHVALLSVDARPAPGWLVRMHASLHAEPDAVALTPWCNAGETAGWPRLGRVEPAPDSARIALAAAVAAMPPVALPAAVDHCVLLRAGAARRIGGIDAASYRSGYAALIDLSLRLAANGGRVLLCTQAFVARDREGRPAEGDLERVAARWPRWTADLAEFLMRDPAADARRAVAAALVRLEAGVARQPVLFPPADALA